MNLCSQSIKDLLQLKYEQGITFYVISLNRNYVHLFFTIRVLLIKSLITKILVTFSKQ